MTSPESGGITNPETPPAAASEGITGPNTPSAGGSDAEQPSGAAARKRRAHRFLVPVLLVLATIIGIPAAFAVWVNRQALNTSNWTSTSSQILKDKRVQTALSAYLVHELFANVNVSADLQKTLPKELQPLAGPAAAGLQQLAGSLTPKLLASPQAQAAWVQANRAAHKELLKVLNGGGPAVSTKAGVVTLNLHTVVAQLAATLGISSQVAAVQSKLQGSTGASARAAAQKKLGITLPPANGQLVILRSNQLKTAQDIANAVKNLAIVLPAISLLLFALAVYLARGRRRRALRTTGWCFVLIGVVLLVIRRVAGNAVVNGLVKVPANKPAVHDVWSIGTSLLHSIAVAMIAYGIVIVVAAWLAGSTRPATETRKFLAPSLRDSPALAYGSVGAVLLLVVLWGPTPAFRNVWWILVFAALLALGVTMLRRETAREFPGVEHGQARRDFQATQADARSGQTASPPAPATPATQGAAASTESSPAADAGRIETLERLAALRDSGAITNDEYQAEKTHVMSNGT
jgi:Short C-terminal domain